MKRSIGILSLVTVVSLLWPLGANAQVGTPPLGPTAMALAPPCLDPDLPPDHPGVPCFGILSFTEGTSAGERANIVRGAGAGLRFNFTLVNAAAVFVPNEATLSALLADPNVVALIPDRPIHAIVKPDKPGGGKGKKDGGGGGQVVPSGVQRLGAAPGTLPVTGSGVGVAIVDTGLDFAHADLAAATDCFTAFDSCQDDNGHGTHVGGTVAALNNDIDVVGVAPDATPYAVKVLDNTGTGSDSTVMAGLDWVGSNAISLIPPIRVVNMSLSRPGTLDDNVMLRKSIQAVTDLGISVVVSAGNDPNKEVSDKVPATYPEVMAIASTTALDGSNKCRFFSGFIAADTASFFTTDGNFDADPAGIGITISAPGEKQENIHRGCIIKSEGILSLNLGGGTTRKSGTSMAAPHVAGVVALMVEQAGGTLDPEFARTLIWGNADRFDEAPLDSPTTSYTFDGEREGIVSACGALGAC